MNTRHLARTTLALPPTTQEWLLKKSDGRFEEFVKGLFDREAQAEDSLCQRFLANAPLGVEGDSEFARRRNTQEMFTILVLTAHYRELMEQVVKRHVVADVITAGVKDTLQDLESAPPARALSAMITWCLQVLADR